MSLCYLQVLDEKPVQHCWSWHGFTTSDLSEVGEIVLFGDLHLVQALKHAEGLNQDNNIPIQLRAIKTVQKGECSGKLMQSVIRHVTMVKCMLCFP